MDRKQDFINLEVYWGTVKVGFIRELPSEARIQIESIYKDVFKCEWLPNRYCKECYFKAIKELIEHFNL
jgi:hypothetical protein